MSERLAADAFDGTHWGVDGVSWAVSPVEESWVGICRGERMGGGEAWRGTRHVVREQEDEGR
jgi:hypothetical protein